MRSDYDDGHGRTAFMVSLQHKVAYPWNTTHVKNAVSLERGLVKWKLVTLESVTAPVLHMGCVGFPFSITIHTGRRNWLATLA